MDFAERFKGRSSLVTKNGIETLLSGPSSPIQKASHSMKSPPHKKNRSPPRPKLDFLSDPPKGRDLFIRNQNNIAGQKRENKRNPVKPHIQINMLPSPSTNEGAKSPSNLLIHRKSQPDDNMYMKTLTVPGSPKSFIPLRTSKSDKDQLSTMSSESLLELSQRIMDILQSQRRNFDALSSASHNSFTPSNYSMTPTTKMFDSEQHKDFYLQRGFNNRSAIQLSDNSMMSNGERTPGLSFVDRQERILNKYSYSRPDLEPISNSKGNNNNTNPFIAHMKGFNYNYQAGIRHHPHSEEICQRVIKLTQTTHPVFLQQTFLSLYCQSLQNRSDVLIPSIKFITVQRFPMDLESSFNYIFSQDLEFLAEVEANKLLRIFEISTGKEYFLTLSNEGGLVTSSEMGKISNSDKSFVIIGDEQGSIKLYNYKGKTLDSVLKGRIIQIKQFIEHVSRVLALRIREESNTLFSISADKKIIQWDLTTMNHLKMVESFDIDKKGKAGEIRCDLIKDDGHLLISLDNKIILFNLELKKAEKKYKGHPTSINFLKSMLDSKYFVSCANEDSINIWSVDEELPAFSIPVPSRVFLGIDFCKLAKGYFLLASYSNASLLIWLLRMTKAGISISKHVTIPFHDDLLGARIFERKYLLLAISEQKKPKFHTIPLFSDEDSLELKTQDQLINELNNTINKGLNKLEKSKNTKKNVNNDYHVMGERDEDVLGRYSKINGSKSQQALKEIDDFFIMDEIDPKNDEANKDQSMESLGVVLFQALHNNDRDLLEYCFNSENEELISNTVKKLSNSKVPVFLEKITERIDSNKDNIKTLTWMKYLLKYHTTFLIKNPNTSQKLAPLVALLERRTISLDKVYRLKGKLDMILDIDQEAKRQTKKNKKFKIDTKPLVVYEEGELVQKASKQKEKLTQNLGYTSAMQDLEEREEEKRERGQKEFSDSISSDEGMDDEEFDAYLEEHADNLGEEDDDKESDEEDSDGNIEFD